MKHTPGPWRLTVNKIFATDEKGAFNIADMRGWGHLTGKGIGAWGMSEDDAMAVQDANGRLIAAAPELLQACKDLLLTNVHGVKKSCDHDYPCFCAEAMARAAIRKAEGGE